MKSECVRYTGHSIIEHSPLTSPGCVVSCLFCSHASFAACQFYSLHWWHSCFASAPILRSPGRRSLRSTVYQRLKQSPTCGLITSRLAHYCLNSIGSCSLELELSRPWLTLLTLPSRPCIMTNARKVVPDSYNGGERTGNI